MFISRGISILDEYLSGIVESTWKSYKSEWNMFVEENHTDTDWENKNEYKKTFLEFLNWAFIGKRIKPLSINITCNAISKLIT
jgi:hypothetical protein